MGGSLGCLRRTTVATIAPLPQHDRKRKERNAETHNDLDRGTERQREREGDTQQSIPSALPVSSSSSSPSPLPVAGNVESSSSTSPPALSIPLSCSSPLSLPLSLVSQSWVRKLKDVKRTMFAQCLDDEELERFSELFDFVTFSPGQIIFKQTAEADVFYIIRKGEVNMNFQDKQAMHNTGTGTHNHLHSNNRTSIMQQPAQSGAGLLASPTQTATAVRSIKVLGGKDKRRATSMLITDTGETPRGGQGYTYKALFGMNGNTDNINKKQRKKNRKKEQEQLQQQLLMMNTVTEQGSDPSGSPMSQSSSVFPPPPSPPPAATMMTSLTPKASRPSKQENDRTQSRMFSNQNVHARHVTTAILPPIESEEITTARQNGESLNCFALLTTKTAGDSFGLEALRYGHHQRTCACIARTECTLLALTNTKFHSFVASLHDKEKRKKLSDLVGDSIQACLSKMPYLSGVSPAKLSLLSSLFVWTMLPAKQVLFTEGERDKKGNGLYFLYEGTVGVYCKDTESPSQDGSSKLLKELNSGVLFGELGLIIHLPRTATITAHTDCLLLHLPHRSFHNFLHLTPEILTKFREQIETYQLNVVYLLENEIIAQYFFQHCAREYSTENLEFWWEAKRFRLQQFTDQQEMRKEAERVIMLYITDSSDKQINLKGNTQKNILNILNNTQTTDNNNNTDNTAAPGIGQGQAQVVDQTLFLEAENEILSLLATDSFSRFKASSLFRECLEEMHARVRSSSISLPSRPRQAGEGIEAERESDMRATHRQSPSSSSSRTEDHKDDSVEQQQAAAIKNVDPLLLASVASQSHVVTSLNDTETLTESTTQSPTSPRHQQHTQASLQRSITGMANPLQPVQVKRTLTGKGIGDAQTTIINRTYTLNRPHPLAPIITQKTNTISTLTPTSPSADSLTSSSASLTGITATITALDREESQHTDTTHRGRTEQEHTEASSTSFKSYLHSKQKSLGAGLPHMSIPDADSIPASSCALTPTSSRAAAAAAARKKAMQLLQTNGQKQANGEANSKSPRPTRNTSFRTAARVVTATIKFTKPATTRDTRNHSHTELTITLRKQLQGQQRVLSTQSGGSIKSCCIAAVCVHTINLT